MPTALPFLKTIDPRVWSAIVAHGWGDDSDPQGGVRNAVNHWVDLLRAFGIDTPNPGATPAAGLVYLADGSTVNLGTLNQELVPQGYMVRSSGPARSAQLSLFAFGGQQVGGPVSPSDAAALLRSAGLHFDAAQIGLPDVPSFFVGDDGAVPLLLQGGAVSDSTGEVMARALAPEQVAATGRVIQSTAAAKGQTEAEVTGNVLGVLAAQGASPQAVSAAAGAIAGPPPMRVSADSALGLLAQLVQRHRAAAVGVGVVLVLLLFNLSRRSR